MTWAPGPYQTQDIGSTGGTGYHCYVIDRDGRKIGVAWGPHKEKVWTVALFAASFEMRECLEMVRDANRSDPHIPPTVLARIEAVLAKLEGKDDQ